MKFNKLLRNYIKKYNIPADYWFDYKFCKKQIKYLFNVHPHNPNYCQQNGDECCICLDKNCNNMMHTFCCKNTIHYGCILDVIMYTNCLCPLCRQNILDYFKPFNKCTLTDDKQFDAKIISLLSTIYLNIMKIENILQKHIIKSEKITQKYCNINYIAVIKICKKINKYLNIDVRQYFIDAIKKKNIIRPYEKTSNIFCSFIKRFKQKLMI